MTIARPPMPARSPARRESLPMVADTVCTCWGTKRTGSDPYLRTSARYEACALVKGLDDEPLMTAVPWKLGAWMVGADSTTPSSSNASRLHAGGLAVFCS